MPSRGYPDRKINPAFLVSVDESHQAEEQEHNEEEKKEYSNLKSNVNFTGGIDAKSEPIVITSSDSSSLTTSASSSTTVHVHKVAEPNYIAMPSSLRKLQRRFPSLEHTLIMECTRCRRWVATEVLHHISDNLLQTTEISFVDESALASLPPLTKKVKKAKECEQEEKENANIKNKRHRSRYSDDTESNSVSLVNSMNLEWHSPRLRAIAERHTKDNKTIIVNDAEMKQENEEFLESLEQKKKENEEQPLESLENKPTNLKWEEQLLHQLTKKEEKEELSPIIEQKQQQEQEEDAKQENREIPDNVSYSNDYHTNSNSLAVINVSNVVIPSTRPELELYIPNPKTFRCTWYDCEKADVFMDLRREWLGKLHATTNINSSSNSNDNDNLIDDNKCTSFIEELEHLLAKKTLLNDQLAHEMQIRRSERIVHQSLPTQKEINNNNNNSNSSGATHKEITNKNSKTSSSSSLPFIHGPMDDFLRRCNAQVSKIKMQNESKTKQEIDQVNVENNSLLSTSLRVNQLQETLNRVHLLQANVPLLPISQNAHKHGYTKHNNNCVAFANENNTRATHLMNNKQDNMFNNSIRDLNNTNLNVLLHNEEVLLSSFCYVVCERCGKVRRVAQPFPGGSPFVCELVYPYHNYNCKFSEEEFIIVYTKHYLLQQLLNCVDYHDGDSHDKAKVASLEVERLRSLPKELEHEWEELWEKKVNDMNSKGNISSHVQSYELSNTHLERYCNVFNELENDPLLQMMAKIIEDKCNNISSVTKRNCLEQSINNQTNTFVEDKENVHLSNNTDRNKNGKRIRTENKEQHNGKDLVSLTQCRLDLFPTIKALSMQLRRRSMLPSSKYLWLSPREVQQKRESTLRKLYLDETHGTEIVNKSSETAAKVYVDEDDVNEEEVKTTKATNTKVHNSSTTELADNKKTEKAQTIVCTNEERKINKHKADVTTNNTTPTVKRKRGRRSTRIPNKAIESESHVASPELVLSKNVKHYNSVSDDTQNTNTSDGVEVLDTKNVTAIINKEENVNYDIDVDEDDKCIADLLVHSNLPERISDTLTHSIITITDSLSSTADDTIITNTLSSSSSTTLPAEPQTVIQVKQENNSTLIEKAKGKRSCKRRTLSSVNEMSNKSNRRGRKKHKRDEEVHMVSSNNEILGVDNTVEDIKDEEEILHWVLCDRCNKWRIVPRPLPTNLEYWECNMRDDHTTCDDTDDETRVARGTMVYPT